MSINSKFKFYNQVSNLLFNLILLIKHMTYEIGQIVICKSRKKIWPARILNYVYINSAKNYQVKLIELEDIIVLPQKSLMKYTKNNITKISQYYGIQISLIKSLMISEEEMRKKQKKILLRRNSNFRSKRKNLINSSDDESPSIQIRKKIYLKQENRSSRNSQQQQYRIQKPSSQKIQQKTSKKLKRLRKCQKIQEKQKNKNQQLITKIQSNPTKLKVISFTPQQLTQMNLRSQKQMEKFTRLSILEPIQPYIPKQRTSSEMIKTQLIDILKILSLMKKEKYKEIQLKIQLVLKKIIQTKFTIQEYFFNSICNILIFTLEKLKSIRNYDWTAEISQIQNEIIRIFSNLDNKLKNINTFIALQNSLNT